MQIAYSHVNIMANLLILALNSMMGIGNRSRDLILHVLLRPGGVVASTFASHAEDQGSILVRSRSVTKPWCEW